MGLVRRDDCCLILVDVQERLYPAMWNRSWLAGRIAVLLEGLRACRVPRIVAEQYPQGLGPTVPELAGFKEEGRVFAKTSFGCLGDQALAAAVDGLARPQVVLCGIEAHVCVLQTAAQLLERGREVFVAWDGVGSRRREDADRALARLEAMGAQVAGVESVLFEVLRDSRDADFKAVARLLKDPPPGP